MRQNTKMSKKRLLPPQLFYLSAAAILITGYFEKGQTNMSYLGLLILILAILVAVREKRRFAENETTIYPDDRPSRLLTDGLYRYSRNPMYLAMVIGLIGIWIFSGGLLPGVIVLLFAAVIHHRFILLEEENLEAVFGEQYRTYKIRVRRWL